MLASALARPWRTGVPFVFNSLELAPNIFYSKCFPDLSRRGISSSPVWKAIPQKPSWSEKVEVPDASILHKIYKKIFKEKIPRVFLKNAGVLLLTKCTEADTYEQFVKVLDLPDTFHTWFLITELHVWMVNVRIMAGNTDDSNLVRKSMVETMWNDCLARMSKIKGISQSEKKDYLIEMHEEFLAGLLIYDLGIGSDDRELANSIWRRLFLAEDPPDFRKIEMIVQYVRENTSALEKVSLNDIIMFQKFNWRPLRQSSI